MRGLRRCDSRNFATLSSHPLPFGARRTPAALPKICGRPHVPGPQPRESAVRRKPAAMPKIRTIPCTGDFPSPRSTPPAHSTLRKARAKCPAFGRVREKRAASMGRFRFVAVAMGICALQTSIEPVRADEMLMSFACTTASFAEPPARSGLSTGFARVYAASTSTNSLPASVGTGSPASRQSST